MNIEEARLECLAMNPNVEETLPFGPENIVMKIGGKMFALLPLDTPDMLTLKCQPERLTELCERFHGINGAYHFNKKHWLQIQYGTDVPDELIRELIANSYTLVSSALPRKTRAELGIPVTPAR